MKYTRFIAVCVVIIGMVFVGVFPEKAQSRIVTNVQPDISAEQYNALVVEDFETQADWVVETVPKKHQDPKKDPVPVLELKYVDGGPADLIPEKWSPLNKGLDKKKCLGIHFKFKYPGFNSVHLLPPLEVRWDDPTKKVMTYDSRAGQEVQERAIQLPGRAKAVSVWVHGRGNNYDLEVWIKDYKGDVHILKMGSLNFVGWRPMKAYIPEYVPQETNSYPQTRVTKIVRFVIRAKPEAGNEDVYLFFDQLKVLTDTFEVNFDGQNLHQLMEQGGGTK
ncbi:MAG: flagellar filament outer layer protein FlaA [Spirochaetes bacterium]|nr:flagellar filament outer layer protein FlaA [Spirochaetota bacterium]